MRFGRIIVAVMLPLIAACKILPESLEQPPPESGVIQSNVLDDQGQPVEDAVRPKPRPNGSAPEIADIEAADLETATEPAADVSILQPEVEQKSSEQIVCEKRGGSWSRAGKSSSKTCIKRTRDAGKQCRKQNDCSSLCLARSGTCAPVAPLFGCNEIFQNDGSRVTLCID